MWHRFDIWTHVLSIDAVLHVLRVIVRILPPRKRLVHIAMKAEFCVLQVCHRPGAVVGILDLPRGDQCIVHSDVHHVCEHGESAKGILHAHLRVENLVNEHLSYVDLRDLYLAVKHVGLYQIASIGVILHELDHELRLLLCMLTLHYLRRRFRCRIRKHRLDLLVSVRVGRGRIAGSREHHLLSQKYTHSLVLIMELG